MLLCRRATSAAVDDGDDGLQEGIISRRTRCVVKTLLCNYSHMGDQPQVQAPENDRCRQTRVSRNQNLSHFIGIMWSLDE